MPALRNNSAAMKAFWPSIDSDWGRVEMGDPGRMASDRMAVTPFNVLVAAPCADGDPATTSTSATRGISAQVRLHSDDTEADLFSRHASAAFRLASPLTPDSAELWHGRAFFSRQTIQ